MRKQHRENIKRMISRFFTQFKAGIRPGIACTCAAVEVHVHSDTPTQRLPITPTVVAVSMIKY